MKSALYPAVKTCYNQGKERQGKLYAHLLETEDAAQAMLDSMMSGMAKAAGAAEELKAPMSEGMGS